MGKILHRYLLRELVTPFLLGLTIFTFVLLLARLLKLIELVVNRGLPALQILELIGFLLPAFMEVTLPMAMLLAILIAFGRLSADAELVAIRSSGVSLYQLLPPVATFVLVVTAMTMLLSMVGRPWGNRSMRAALWEIAQTHAAAGLKPQVFNDEFPGLVIYADQIDGTRDRLVHVLISDERDPKQRNTIFAREGTMLSDPDAQTITLRLLNGAIHSSEGEGKAQADYQTEFESYDVNLDLRQALAGADTLEDRPAEMTLAQLDDAITRKQAEKQSYGPELVEWHRKFAIPFACVVFGLVAVPLGTERSRAVKSRGFAVSLAVIFVYYILLSAGQGLAQQNRIPAIVGLWTPNVVFALLGVWLLQRAARERPLLGGWVEPFAAALRARMPRRLVARVGA